MTTVFLIALAGLIPAVPAHAQPLGTFRWQLEPHCNVVALAVTQVGDVYRLEGTDDQCGAGRDRAAVVGLAFGNPDGSIGFGLTIVTSPGAAPIHVDAQITLATLSGTWRSNGASGGTFQFTTGQVTPGYPMPAPAPVVPPSISLLSGGGIVARADGESGIPASGAGTRMMWYPGKSAFRAGRVNGPHWDDPGTGLYSAAFGLNTVASGASSVAFGEATTATAAASTALGHSTTAAGSAAMAVGRETIASGVESMAFGNGTQAVGAQSLAGGLGTSSIGDHSVALGEGTVANGRSSTALGEHSTASGNQSLAVGYQATTTGFAALAAGYGAVANGDVSVAIGTRAVTVPAARGSFVFADTSSEAPFTSFAPDEFVVRAAGGVGFYTNAATTTGAEMAPGGGSWAALSDANMKENFRDVAGEEVLAKLAAMPVREWNYISQDASIRHMGPTAQDFRAAFGLGDFPLRINTTDTDGVALAAIKALEVRTRSVAERDADHDSLRAQLAAANDAIAALRDRLNALEQLLNRR
ncbi:MAG: tail fiber domain-containing protein [Acidobacteria bacterium]|nr:tail fiber domain-containing protein [Acidobacteriota bacterium]